MLKKMMKKTDMTADVERILISEQELQDRIQEVAAQISKDYAGKCPIVVGVLNGVIPFYAAMVQAMTIPLVMDFRAVT